jgi:hypothetical protein
MELSANGKVPVSLLLPTDTILQGSSRLQARHQSPATEVR